jgi:hypothetical protein
MGDRTPFLITRGDDSGGGRTSSGRKISAWLVVGLVLIAVVLVIYFTQKGEPSGSSLLSPPMPWKDWRA